MSSPARASAKRLLALALGTAGVGLGLFGLGALWLRISPRPVSLARPTPPVRPAPIQGLRKIYGRKLYSQFDEETLIRSFFKDARSGVFVDLGAGNFKVDSNTFFLEEHLGWTGIAVDANVVHGADYTRFRPGTRFVNAFVSDRSDTNVDFFVFPSDWKIASGRREHLLQYDEVTSSSVAIEKVKVPTLTIDRLLERARLHAFDFLSIDIEGFERQALSGFSIRRYRPKLVCIEMDHASRPDISAYFASNDYVRIDENLAMDSHNWYFTPRPPR